MQAQPALEPNRSLPRTVGILNLTFGAILLLCGVCSTISLLSLAVAGTMANQAQVQAQMEQAWQREREQGLARLQQELDKAAEPADRQRIEQQMQALREAKAPKIDVAAMYGIKDPAVVTFWSIEMISGIVVNLLLIVAGIGLLSVAEWARKLSIGIAVLKLIRLVVLYGYASVAVVPVMARDTAQAVHDMAASVPQAPGQELPPAAEMAQGIGGAWFAGIAVFVILAAVYPLLMLRLLTRPAVKAATQGRDPTLFRPDAM